MKKRYCAKKVVSTLNNFCGKFTLSKAVLLEKTKDKKEARPEDEKQIG